MELDVTAFELIAPQQKQSLLNRLTGHLCPCLRVTLPAEHESDMDQRLKRSLSFVPLPILDVMLKAFSRLKRCNSRRESRRRSSYRKVRVKQLDPSDPYSPWFRTGKPPRTHLTDLDSIESIIWRVMSQNGSKVGMGWRKTISKQAQVLSDGSTRVERTYDSAYSWLTYFEVQTQMEDIRKGLLALGVRKKDRVSILMESRVERKIIIAAVMRLGAIPALVPHERRIMATYYMINQLDSEVLIVSADTALRLTALAPNLTHTTRVIVVEDEVAGEIEPVDIDPESLANLYEQQIEFMTIAQVQALGRRAGNSAPYNSHPDDAAFIVFTSGSTGIPKSVIWPYRSVLNGVKNLAAVLSGLHLPEDSCCILTPCPLVMEVMYTCILLSCGIRVAYTSAETLMPKSVTQIRKDFAYDLELIHPDMILAVPQTLNEIRKLFESSPCIRLKSFLYVNNRSKPKLGSKNSWPPDGDHYMLKYRLFGGKLKALIIGSAHISSETYNFFKRKLDVPSIVQHYACAESCSSVLLDADGDSMGSCGFPLWGTLVRLIDWQEGGYFVTDKPNPRGEIVLGGDSVSDGYYKDLFRSVFVEESGKTWCITGDIGEILPDGSVRVIDRKVDLFKEPSGNYVSPAKIESELKTSSLVENVFVYGHSNLEYVVAIVRPNEEVVKQMAQSLGKEEESFPFLCYDDDIRRLFLQQLQSHGRSRGLYEYEIPQKIRLSSHKWSSQVGYVTDMIVGGYKPRRHQLREFFKNDIAMMYD